MDTKKDIIALTMGDPAGIGPEIIAKLFSEKAADNCVIFGDASTLKAAFAMLDTKSDIHVIPDLSAFQPDKINLLQTSSQPFSINTGAVSALAGQAAFDAFAKAIGYAMAGKISGIVTGPLNKEALVAAGHEYPGHTEILADLANSQVAMMLANEDIRTVLVTVHLSLRDAIDAGDFAAQCSAIRLAESGTRAMGIKNPRVAVAGLNPHAGESGLFGHEELEIITPAIDACRREGINVSGPYPGDTVFMQARQGKFDVVVAQYHDQGLIPVKYLGLEKGVNITLGLPFVRTSPDHGTAFDIAGKGIADPSSMGSALRMARQLIANIKP